MAEKWNDAEARGFHRREMLPMHAHVVPRGDSFVTTVVIPDPVIRIRALDARSRQPIANALVDGAWVLPKGTTAPKPKDRDAQKPHAMHVLEAPSWNIVADHPVYGKSPHGFGGKDWSRLKRALVLLGYPAGEGKKADKHLEKALTQFRTDHGIAEPKPKAKDHQTVPKVIAEHNKRAFDAVRRYLRAYTFDCSGSGEWDSVAEDALVKWQHLYFPSRKKPAKVPTESVCKELVAQSSHFATDGHGVVKVPIPLHLMKEGFTLVISFQNFGIIARKDTAHWGDEGEVLVEWPGSQNLDEGKLGWRLRAPTEEKKAIDALPEFCWASAFEVPAIPKLALAELPAADAKKAGFNAEYGPKTSCDIDVIGLVWCQPAWDDVEDPKQQPSNYDVLMPTMETPPKPKHRHLHVVTKICGLDPEHYGLVDIVPSSVPAHYRGRTGPHEGIDVHVKNDAPAFAFHGGTATNYYSNGTGYAVVVSDPHRAECRLEYFHLHESGRAKGSVRAGEIVGTLGRTGNIDKEPFTPSHVHMKHKGDVGFTYALAALPDAANRVCIPTNDTIPRLFPCRSQMQSGAVPHEKDNKPFPEGTAYASLASCAGANAMFVDACWAVKRLVCPYLSEASNDLLKRQAQLQHTKDLKKIDLDETSKKYEKAIKAFRVKNGLSAVATIDAATASLLDQQAPVIAPEQ